MSAIIAVLNRHGVSLAADSAVTLGNTHKVVNSGNKIFTLSKYYPVAIMTYSNASFMSVPWDIIINNYKRMGELEEKENFEDYAKDFEKYLTSLPVSEDYSDLSTEDSNIIFMGYGKDDLFPQIYDTCISLANGKWKFDEDRTEIFKVSHQEFAHINLLGNLDSVYTLIWGATRDVNNILLENHLRTFKVYKERVLERFKGTEYESFVTKKLEAYEAKDDFMMKMSEAVDKTSSNVLDGIETFSVEDMVMAAETIVNAEVRLDHLGSGCKTPLNTTREIAVITRAEGLTWIKHSLYAI